MATLRLRYNKWQARVARKGQPSISKSFLTRQDAERWGRQVEVEIERGSYQSRTEAERLTFADIITRYLAEVAPGLKGYKDEFIRLNALKRHPLTRYSMVALTPEKIAAYRDERLAKVGAGTVIRELASISAIINHSRREWRINMPNPVELVRKPKAPKGRNRILTDAEIGRIKEELKPAGRRSIWMLPAFELALQTAMRRGELLALRWADINMGQRVAFLQDTKNGESRSVPLSTAAIQLLDSIPRSLTGRVIPLTTCALEAAFKKATRRASLEDVHFHDIRHTAVTRMAKLLPNLIELSAVTGHKSLAMLKRYYHPSAAELARKLG